jgi:stealth protein CR2
MDRDVVYIFRSTGGDDAELRYSLRSLAASRVAPRKVWVFGDRPRWLADDKRQIEHVPHEYVARAFRWKLPVVNNFLLTFLASLIPGLAFDFFWFADDYILLEPVTAEDLARVRVLEDLAKLETRGRGLYKDALWRTYDTLRRFGYATLNYECHVPLPYTRRRIFDAYCDLQDFVSEDRYYGLLVHLAVLNHAAKHDDLGETVWLHDEGRFVGFYKTPPGLAEVRERCRGKAFLNFDDAAFGSGLSQFLAERFAEPCIYEQLE